MAEAKKEEKIFTIPFRKIYECHRMLRAKRAAHFVRAFLVRHMKVDEDKVRIGKGINEAIWARGIQKPPRKIKVHVLKNEEGTVFAELVGVEIKTPTKEELKKKAEKLAEKEKKRREGRKERKEKPVEEEAKEERAEKEKAAGRLVEAKE
ncbi:MAG: 50S ribosomal protein L31e [Candidatus Aenigmatarchaeota archaeon]